MRLLPRKSENRRHFGARFPNQSAGGVFDSALSQWGRRLDSDEVVVLGDREANW